MDGPGERLCVGEPERLSLDDWWKPEEKLRLLCMGGGGVCLDSFFKMLRRRLHRGERCQVCFVNNIVFCMPVKEKSVSYEAKGRPKCKRRTFKNGIIVRCQSEI